MLIYRAPVTPLIPRKWVHLDRFSPRKVADQFVGPPEKQEQRETVIGHLTISGEFEDPDPCYAGSNPSIGGSKDS